MDLIANKHDLLENISKIDEYLNKKVDPEYSFAIDLIKRGICFVALEISNNIRFYPSRFLGYKGNTMDSHVSNEYKDGTETTPQITSIVSPGKEPIFDILLEKEYIEYCNSLGFTANKTGAFGVQRKYWRVFISWFD